MISYFNVRFLFLFWLTSWDLRACKGRAFAIMSSRTVETKYGQIRGTLLKFSDENLKPVESYKSLQYASTLGTQMRFMPPTSPSDRWKYIRVAFTYRSVCPQPIFKEEDVVGYLAKGEIDRRKRMVSFVMSQSEECLNLNLYVPTDDVRLIKVTQQPFASIVPPVSQLGLMRIKNGLSGSISTTPSIGYST